MFRRSVRTSVSLWAPSLRRLWLKAPQRVCGINQDQVNQRGACLKLTSCPSISAATLRRSCINTIKIQLRLVVRVFRQLEETERVLPDWLPEGTDDDTLRNRWGSGARPIFYANALVGMPRNKACVVEDIDGSVRKIARTSEREIPIGGCLVWVCGFASKVKGRWWPTYVRA